MSSSADVGMSQLPAPPGSENVGMSQLPAPPITDNCGMCSLPVFRPTPFSCSKYVLNEHGVIRRLILEKAYASEGYPGRVILDKQKFTEHSSICLILVYPDKVLFVECLRDGLIQT